ncbi:tRNA (adenine22-N1)-methyltransferase [Lachnotalea glycerini]|uniref:SAM-dependent methyltransferase n=1 Tax=Lachnotalea glycerini TaxID=1763509 RepID=A0A255I4D8_9FIRM|nr:class I SAM-dependent methyltransferase [Lachnotalea glycerini]PXV93577.1 tRNA (adenine22-N1)-methyltransferase [Lachnotalea glycerini]RDY32534.1 SAM-dependent methyltransferase [Lachnotalea glycerini]
MQLSNRLSAVADMVSKGNRLVDVGTDHGYLPIYLIEKGQIPSAIALDINQGPIQRAKEHIGEHNLEGHIETRLSDGVAALKQGEGDTLVIAGMGGGLVIHIITNGEQVLPHFKEFILQPQSEIEQVRRFLIREKYTITQEHMIEEEGKFYPMMKAIKGVCIDYDRTVFYKYGKGLLESRNEVLKHFLHKELQTYISILDKLLANNQQSALTRSNEIKQEIKYIKEAMSFYEV